MAKFIESGQLEDLTSFLETSESPVKATDTYPGLIKWCKPVGGEGLFGIPVDCNPKVFWFNQDMLGAAGSPPTRPLCSRAAPETKPRWTTC
jgi:multiple sugar transport system substrate-binding protein